MRVQGLCGDWGPGFPVVAPRAPWTGTGDGEPNPLCADRALPPPSDRRWCNTVGCVCILTLTHNPRWPCVVSPSANACKEPIITDVQDTLAPSLSLLCSGQQHLSQRNTTHPSRTPSPQSPARSPLTPVPVLKPLSPPQA